MSDDDLRDLLSGYRPAGPGPQLRRRILMTRRTRARWRLGLLGATAMTASVWVIAFTLASRAYRAISNERVRATPEIVSETIKSEAVELTGDDDAAAFIAAQAAAAAQATADDNAGLRALPNR